LIQARKAYGRATPAQPGRLMHFAARSQRKGAVQLFAGLLVHIPEKPWRAVLSASASSSFRSSCGCSWGACENTGWARTRSSISKGIWSGSPNIGNGF
jgi:hypothetical protein